MGGFLYFRYNGEKLASFRQWRPVHFGSKQPNANTSNSSLSHELRSEWVSEQTNECIRPCQQSEQGGASQWVSFTSKRAKEWMDGQGAQNLCPDSWLFWTNLVLSCFRCRDCESSWEKGGKGPNEFWLDLYVAWLIFSFFHLMLSWHYGTKPGRFVTSYHTLSHELESERVREQTNECLSEASSAVQANEWVAQEKTSEWTSEWPSTYVSIHSSSEPQWCGGEQEMKGSSAAILVETWQI